MSLGLKIIIARREAKLDQGELAEKTGVSRVTLSRYENDKIPEVGIRNLVKDTIGDHLPQ